MAIENSVSKYFYLRSSIVLTFSIAVNPVWFCININPFLDIISWKCHLLFTSAVYIQIHSWWVLSWKRTIWTVFRLQTTVAHFFVFLQEAKVKRMLLKCTVHLGCRCMIFVAFWLDLPCFFLQFRTKEALLQAIEVNNLSCFHIFPIKTAKPKSFAYTEDRHVLASILKLCFLKKPWKS